MGNTHRVPERDEYPVPQELDYDEPRLEEISERLGTICQKSKPKEYDGKNTVTYSCERLKQIMWCASALHRYPDEPDVKSFCREPNKFLRDEHYNSNYHIRQLLRECMHNEDYATEAETVEEMRRFGYVYDKISKNGYSNVPPLLQAEEVSTRVPHGIG